MVSVDYATLYQIIRQHLYTGIFYAKITTARPHQEGEVELYIQDGEILACFFTNTQGQRYKWDNWEARLSPLGRLNWDSKAFPTPEASPEAHVPPASSGYRLSSPPPGLHNAGIPYQEIILTQAQLSQLPISYRSVYFLVNGNRTIEDIALTLGRSPQEVSQIVEHLSKLGAVRLH